MKVIELPCDESKFTYPEEMKKLVEKLKDRNIKLNVDLITLEKLWYVFSEKYCASFLIVDDETVSDFVYWAKNVDCEFAQKCDYYGYIEEEEDEE